MLNASSEYAPKIRRVLEHTPNPPRPVSAAEAIKEQYRQRFLFGFALGGSGIFVLTLYVAIRIATATTESITILGIALLGGAVFMTTPAFLGIAYARALRFGQLAHAVAVRGNTERWSLAVPHPDGDFDTDWDVSSDWANQIRKGTTLIALVHPHKKKVLLVVGPAG